MKEFVNKVAIRKDRKNIYIELSVDSSSAARFGLLVLIFLITCFLFFFMFFIADNNDFNESFLIPFIGILAIDIWFIRSFLWNKFGKEYFIISKKSFSYYYDYGIIQTPKKSFKCNELTINVEKVFEDDVKGKLLFLNYNEETDLREEIHPSSVVIPDSEIDYVIREIYSFLDIKIEEEKNFGGFHYNK